MITFYAPKWAIDLVQNARRMNTPEARLLALDTLQSQVECPDGLASDMVYEMLEHQFKESNTFYRENAPKWVYAVFNGNDSNGFKSGKLYPVKDVSEIAFYCLAEDGTWSFCLKENCAFLNGGNWTLVSEEESK